MPTPTVSKDVISVSFVPPILTCILVQLLGSLSYPQLLDCQQLLGRKWGLCYPLLSMFSLKCPAQYSAFNECPINTKGIVFSTPWNEFCIC